MNEIEAAKEAVKLYFQGYSAKDAIEKVLKRKKTAEAAKSKLKTNLNIPYID